MKVDLTCPVEVRWCQLVPMPGGGLRAQFQLYNLSERRVSSIEAVAHWLRGGSGLSGVMPLSFRRLRVPGLGLFSVSAAAEGPEDGERVELNISEVCFEDGGSWRAGDGELLEVEEPLPLPPGEKAALVRAAGEDASAFAREEGRTWRCVCGRPNPKEEGRCVRCRRGRGEVLGAFTREAILGEKPRAASLAEAGN